MMKQNKQKYLAPKVRVVSFTTEHGYSASEPEPEKIQTSKASEYGNVNSGYNDWSSSF